MFASQDNTPPPGQIDRDAALRQTGRKRIRKALLTFLAIVAVGAVLFGAYICMAALALQNSMQMHNQVYAESRSPDGRYVATLAYRDGMTFGFYYVSLQDAHQWHKLVADGGIPETEVTEVAAEGLNAIEWQGPHKLVVSYLSSGTDKAEFVKQTKQWHDVSIAYKGL